MPKYSEVEVFLIRALSRWADASYPELEYPTLVERAVELLHVCTVRAFSYEPRNMPRKLAWRFRMGLEKVCMGDEWASACCGDQGPNDVLVEVSMSPFRVMSGIGHGDRNESRPRRDRLMGAICLIQRCAIEFTGMCPYLLSSSMLTARFPLNPAGCWSRPCAG